VTVEEKGLLWVPVNERARCGREGLGPRVEDQNAYEREETPATYLEAIWVGRAWKTVKDHGEEL